MKFCKKQIYLTMNKFYYYGGTLILYILSVVGAVIIKDLGLIFTIFAAFSGSGVSFVFPGFFYVFSEKYYAPLEGRESRKIHIVFAWFYIIVGIIFFIVLLVQGIYNIIEL